MQSKAATVEQYLAELPEERRAILSPIRETILANLPEGYVEQMGYGMIGYVIPLTIHPPGYHCKPSDPVPFANLASQKNHMALYIMHGAQRDFLKAQIEARGEKVDMGGSCFRFKKADALPLDLVAEAIRMVSLQDYLAHHLATIRPSKSSKA